MSFPGAGMYGQSPGGNGYRRGVSFGSESSASFDSDSATFYDQGIHSASPTARSTARNSGRGGVLKNRTVNYDQTAQLDEDQKLAAAAQNAATNLAQTNPNYQPESSQQQKSRVFSQQGHTGNQQPRQYGTSRGGEHAQYRLPKHPSTGPQSAYSQQQPSYPNTPFSASQQQSSPFGRGYPDFGSSKLNRPGFPASSTGPNSSASTNSPATSTPTSGGGNGNGNGSDGDDGDTNFPSAGSYFPDIYTGGQITNFKAYTTFENGETVRHIYVPQGHHQIRLQETDPDTGVTKQLTIKIDAVWTHCVNDWAEDRSKLFDETADTIKNVHQGILTLAEQACKVNVSETQNLYKLAETACTFTDWHFREGKEANREEWWDHAGKVFTEAGFTPKTATTAATSTNNSGAPSNMVTGHRPELSSYGRGLGSNFGPTGTAVSAH